MTNKSSCCFLRNLNGSSPCDIFRIDRNFDALNSIFNDLIITVRRTRRCNRTRTSKNIPALARREISFFDTSAVRGLREVRCFVSTLCAIRLSTASNAGNDASC